MVRLRVGPRRLALALVALGALAIAVGVALVFPPAGLIVAGIALVLFGLYLVDVEGAREPASARPRRFSSH